MQIGQPWGGAHQFESSVNVHREIFSDRFLRADSSRWARNGRTTKDLWYQLWSINGYVRNEFVFGKWSLTPILGFEHVNMYRQDQLALAQQPDLNSTKEGREYNIYNQFLPGVTLEYELKSGLLYASRYEGMTAPSKVFGFLVERNGVVTNPLDGQSINIEPELSWNNEIGWRGNLAAGIIDGQITYFHNTSRNFYAGGRNEVFQQLGRVRVHGVEMAVKALVYDRAKAKVRTFTNVAFLQSKVLRGRLEDKDLFSEVIHSRASRQEFIEKVNANRSAFEIYTTNTSTGEPALLSEEVLSISDFERISASIIQFGGEGLAHAQAPYTPNWNIRTGLDAEWEQLALGISGHYVSEQFTEFHNFQSESADGAIGLLPAYFTLDAYLDYDFKVGQRITANAFLNGKNLTNDIFRASRLNRATSGVFAGAFRQIILGVNVRI